MTSRETELAIAAGALLLLMTRTQAIDWGTGWIWPVPDLVDAPAVVSQEFRPSSHLGVDLMYRRPGGEFFAPAGTPVVAARAGTLWSVTRTPRGWAVVVDHGAPWATFYQHLASVRWLGRSARAATPGPAIAAGEKLGLMGVDPTDQQHVRHLHFATWYRGAGDDFSVDPSAAMRSWPHWRHSPKGTP